MRVIQKMQQGGGMPPFVSYIPIQTPAIPPAYTMPLEASTQNGTANMLDKDMIKLLYEKGIPSDVEAFIDKSGLFSTSLLGNTLSKNNSMLLYKTLLKMLPRIKAENDRFLAALKSADSNGGMGEIAVTDRGDIFVLDDEGKIKLERIENIKDFNSYHILTNSELANYRANNVQAAFNTDITSIIGNAVGMTKITEYLKEVIDKVGTMSMSREGYVGQLSNKIVKGLEYLIAADAKLSDLAGMSLDGLYKVKSLDKTQLQLAKLALNYLLSTLPQNMRTVLKAKAGQFLGDSSQEGVKKIVTALVSSAITGEHSFSLDYLDSLNLNGTKRQDPKEDKNIIDPAKAFLLGLGELKMYKINNGTAYNVNVLGTSAPIVDTQGKTLGTSTLEDVAKSTFSQVLDLRSATMGDQLINASQRNKVIVDGSNVISVDLPIDKEAATTGIIKPDLDSLKRIELAEQEIRDGHIIDEAKKNEIYAKYKLPFKYANGLINTEDYQRFAVLDGSADETAFKTDAFDSSNALNSSLSEILDDNQKANLEQLFKKHDLQFKLGTAYDGSVYIPIRENIINAAMGSGHYPTVQGNNANELDAMEKLAERLKTYVATGPLATLQK